MQTEIEQKITIKNLDFFYGSFQALNKINLKVPGQEITGLIGPSGCGKSTLLRCINRMNDLYDNTKTSGQIIIDQENILDNKIDLISLRKKVGMVFQRPNVFDLSIYDNLALGLKIHRLFTKKTDILAVIEQAMHSIGLWDELKDKLKKNARNLSLEQQQRLCLARAMALKPDIILLDEPCSTLDPISTAKLEELLIQLKEKYTIIIVTHNMQQAARISGFCGFMLLGDLVEFDQTKQIFTSPKDERTDNYITGKFG
jgi:phosphate transport system ATP-binding protein